MPVTNFDNPLKLNKNGGLDVGGPFIFDPPPARPGGVNDPVPPGWGVPGSAVGDVIIRYLLYQSTADASNPPSPPKMIEGSTVMKSTDASWGHTVSKAALASSGIEPGAEVRGIGIAVVTKYAEPPAPPTFETFTWCVNTVVGAPASTVAQPAATTRATS